MPKTSNEEPAIASQLLLIDGNAPFFRGCRKQRINWSKVPFAHLENQAGLNSRRIGRIESDFEGFCQTVSRLGYTGVTLDDVAHLTPWPGHPPELLAKIASYRHFYGRLMETAHRQGLAFYLNTDLMFYTPRLRAAIGWRPAAVANWLEAALRELFADFPLLAGIVTRFGENDGHGVRGDFRSQLVVKTTRHLRTFIRTLLPCFKEMDKTWIFRTWSVGVYPIGDLMWHRRRFQKAFAGFACPNFVLSMKPGESDFFRYLPLNGNFFRGEHRKIVEFQARREYEGFGEYPSFVGWESERHLASLAKAPGFCGAMVWCQTGGWGRFRRLTYVKKSSFWVELNVQTIAEVVRGTACETAIDNFRKRRLPHCPPASFVEFLRLADEAILKTLYVREFAERKLFFRRLRVPPFFFVVWDRVIVTLWIRHFARLMVEDWPANIREADEGVNAVDRMVSLAKTHGIPEQGLQLQRDTFEILAAVRRFFFSDFDPRSATRLESLKRDYASKHTSRYRIRLDFAPVQFRAGHFHLFFRLLFRQRRGYRLTDHLITLRLLPLVYPAIAFFWRNKIPKFIRRQAMGIDVLFR